MMLRGVEKTHFIFSPLTSSDEVSVEWLSWSPFPLRHIGSKTAVEMIVGLSNGKVTGRVSRFHVSRRLLQNHSFTNQDQLNSHSNWIHSARFFKHFKPRCPYNCSLTVFLQQFLQPSHPTEIKRLYSSTSISRANAQDDRTSSRKVSVAIVGSGPSGCYAAKYLLKAVQDRYKNSNGPKLSIQRIDVLERLPTPYGLVRYGVAPDHPDVKNVQNDFDRLFEAPENGGSENPLVNFFGNVHVGFDVSLHELRERYDIVILSYGCQSDRKLNIPGEDQLQGILSAREFVAWYNGHPYFNHIGEEVYNAIQGGDCGSSKKEGVSVVIVGHGNVAIDCARILAKAGPISDGGLYNTDMSLEAWNTLRDLNVRNIFIVGRRGHLQASFTIKELRELTHLEEDGYNTAFLVREDELGMCVSTQASQEELNGPSGRAKGRIDKLLRDVASKGTLVAKKMITSLMFILTEHFRT
jgi:NADPH-dependent glutamate synthase beta subunit-like oxidoreductase